MSQHGSTNVTYKHVRHTDTILFGPNFANFSIYDGRKGHVTGSGRTLRVDIDGIDGYVDFDVSDLVAAAIELLTAGES